MNDILKSYKAEFPFSAAVACQGAEGAYSQIAAAGIFSAPEVLYMRTFDGVFRAVETGLCRFGILPIENSNAGTVTDVYDLMKEHRFYIVRSVKLSISHALLAKDKINIKDIKEVFTHEQAVKQCSRFFEQNPNIKINYCANTAAAARYVAQSGQSNIAAIASEKCAELYRLTAAAKEIQNHKNNYTRFICISKNCEIYENPDKISLMLTVENRPGALYQIIKLFADLGLNLTKLESRPIADTDFEFLFYFDIQASIAAKEIDGLLAELQKRSSLIFLGHYSEICL